MSEITPHYYNYELMKHINGDTQTDLFACHESAAIDCLPFLEDDDSEPKQEEILSFQTETGSPVDTGVLMYAVGANFRKCCRQPCGISRVKSPSTKHVSW